jgi:hypothetical protein
VVTNVGAGARKDRDWLEVLISYDSVTLTIAMTSLITNLIELILTKKPNLRRTH